MEASTISIDEAAGRLGVSRRRVFQLLKEHDIPRERHTFGGKSFVLLDRDALFAMRPAQEVRAASKTAADIRATLSGVVEPGARYGTLLEELMETSDAPAREAYLHEEPESTKDQALTAVVLVEALYGFQGAFRAPEYLLPDEEWDAARDFVLGKVAEILDTYVCVAGSEAGDEVE